MVENVLARVLSVLSPSAYAYSLVYKILLIEIQRRNPNKTIGGVRATTIFDVYLRNYGNHYIIGIHLYLYAIHVLTRSSVCRCMCVFECVFEYVSVLPPPPPPPRYPGNPVITDDTRSRQCFLFCRLSKRELRGRGQTLPQAVYREHTHTQAGRQKNT